MKIQPQNNKELIELEKEVSKLENRVPSIYKKKCLWLTQMENDSMEEMLYVIKTNRDRAADCYLRMNSLIDLLEKRGIF